MIKPAESVGGRVIEAMPLILTGVILVMVGRRHKIADRPDS